ncbi:hypothetical protein TIFTF001_008756 [Ficus carica]|uniref:Peptidase A1 domain-containing protein n=1 Tax=Ficus carica TaxID=3494 RepID=A0AA88A988_FICCA|nr:hypothetical protein TIFTF001_008756 [Ficus carica]
MITGSSDMWFPCTSKYVCTECSLSNIQLPSSPAFDPAKSLSSRPLCCYFASAKKCAWIHGKNSHCRFGSLCSVCQFMFVSWTTEAGREGVRRRMRMSVVKSPEPPLVRDWRTPFPKFLIGCSKSSSRLPLGFVAFGSGKQSLPSQLAVKKFSFRLLSHYYDDSSIYSGLVLDDNVPYTDLTYTSLINNVVVVAEGSKFIGYHYLKLQEIVVGDKRKVIRVEKQLPTRDGNGGTIVDTGIPFAFLERSINEAVRQEFENQMGKFARVPDQGVLGPCFSTTTSDQGITEIPALSIWFDGGARMDFPR